MGELIEYSIPLGNGLIGKIMIPKDITKKEIARLIKYIYTLAIDFEPPTPEEEKAYQEELAINTKS